MTNGEIDMNQVQAMRYELGAWKKCAEARQVETERALRLKDAALVLVGESLDCADGFEQARDEMSRQLSVARHNLCVVEDAVAQLAAERDDATKRATEAGIALVELEATFHAAIDAESRRAVDLELERLQQTISAARSCTEHTGVRSLLASVDRHIGARRMQLRDGAPLAALDKAA